MTSVADTQVGDDLQDGLNDYWSRRAPSYHADQQRPERLADDRRVWSQIWSDALPPSPCRVADLGTGSGVVAWLLHDLGYDVTGVDAAAGMLQEAREHRNDCAGPDFVLGDALQPPLAPSSMDAVTARYVLWTMRDPAVALRAWRAVLRPGGTLAVVDGLWFPDGLPAATGSDRGESGGPQSGSDAGSDDEPTLGEQFARAYAHDGDTLPLAEARSIDDSVAAVREAGFTDVEVRELTAVRELDLRYGVPARHQVTRQYLIRATR